LEKQGGKDDPFRKKREKHSFKAVGIGSVKEYGTSGGHVEEQDTWERETRLIARKRGKREVFSEAPLERGTLPNHHSQGRGKHSRSPRVIWKIEKKMRKKDGAVPRWGEGSFLRYEKDRNLNAEERALPIQPQARIVPAPKEKKSLPV